MTVSLLGEVATGLCPAETPASAAIRALIPNGT
jgi:hypothetical protein